MNTHQTFVYNCRSNADIKAGDILRHIFSYNADLGKVDYAIIYFNKVKTCTY